MNKLLRSTRRRLVFVAASYICAMLLVVVWAGIAGQNMYRDYCLEGSAQNISCQVYAAADSPLLRLPILDKEALGLGLIAVNVVWGFVVFNLLSQIKKTVLYPVVTGVTFACILLVLHSNQVFTHMRYEAFGWRDDPEYATPSVTVVLPSLVEVPNDSEESLDNTCDRDATDNMPCVIYEILDSQYPEYVQLKEPFGLYAFRMLGVGVMYAAFSALLHAGSAVSTIINTKGVVKTHTARLVAAFVLQVVVSVVTFPLQMVVVMLLLA